MGEKGKVQHQPSTRTSSLPPKPKRAAPSMAPSRALPPSVNVTVSRTKKHMFSPRKHGVLVVEASPLWSAKFVAKRPTVYAAMDGLPATTNLDTTEPEWKKKKNDDPLVPFLCFFESKKQFDALRGSVRNKSVRDMKFQKLVSEQCTALLRLDSAEVTSKRKELNDDDEKELKEQEKGFRFYVSDESGEHVFCTEEAKERNVWLAAIQSMISKRRHSMQRRRSATAKANASPAAGRYKMRLY